VKTSDKVKNAEEDIYFIKQLTRIKEAAPDLNDNNTRIFIKKEADFKKNIK
jgi:hypothetical protein